MGNLRTKRCNQPPTPYGIISLIAEVNKFKLSEWNENKLRSVNNIKT